jgi:sugar phosphate isomerase/epimerase
VTRGRGHAILLAGAAAAGVLLPRATRAGAPYEWTDLLAPGDLSSFRAPLGEWRTAARVASAPSDPRRLASTPGSGVVVNGDAGRTVDLLTREEHGDVELHVEFLVPKGSNSGVYLMGRYEVQVLDSFGVAQADYPGNACGGIYPRWLDETNVGGRSPRVDASRPAGEWQSFDVVFRAPRFDARGRKVAHARFEKVLHNGVLVHEDVEVTGPTRAARFESEKDEGPAGPLQLQGDHGPVAYRNLRVRRLEPEPRRTSFDNALAAMDTYTKQRYPESDLTLERQLDIVRAAGYAGVTWDALPPLETGQLRAAAEARGLRLVAIYAGGALSRDGLAWGPTLEKTMPRLAGTGAIVWLHVASRDFAPSSPEGDAAAVPALRRLADLASAHGLRVALYPHQGDWVERVSDATRLARRAGHPALGATFNLCHSLMLGEEPRIADLLAEAAPYLFVATVSGADAGAAGTSWDRLIQTLDRGSFDVAPVLRTLHGLGFAGPVAVQGYGVKGDAADNLRRSREAYDRLAAGVGPKR